MSSLPGILLFILGLLISVAIHELGHLIPAKKFGVKVSQYFVGFGRTLWSRQYRGTEYGIKALPLGGYVSIAGMLAPARPGTKTHKPDGSLTTAQEARLMSAEELEPGQEDQAFWRLSARKKLVVMFGGPLTNFILAGLCLAVVMSGIGMPSYTNGVGIISECVASDEPCGTDNPPAPGAQSELEEGDVILSWGGVPVSTWPEVQEAIAAGSAEPTTVVVERDGRQLDVTVTPILTERPMIRDGEIVLDDAGNPRTEPKPFVGISPAIERERVSLLEVPAATVNLAKATAGIVVRLPVHLWNTASDLVTGTPRDATGVVGIVGIADLAGSVSASESEQYTLVDRASDLLMILGSLNMSLFIFNMLPLLPLDGGHILGALIEGSRRHLAKWRGKPDPGPFDTARLLPLSQGVIVFFIFMTLLLVIADIVNPAF